ncbi:amino acid adenylation domain-containing protein [Actinokineospora guangxiensis]|uniref:Amino acid adenylation domain-containing protein n=1 Tax=Actinokineospora guangxiensis TaxID=1490288 RepID=A0ABW0EUM0_9PSEU
MTEILDRSALRAELVRRRLRGTAAAPTDNRIQPVRRDVPLVLSSAQRRLWILEQLRSGGAEYLISTVLRLRGGLDTAALRTALDALVARHEVLRTRYVVHDGEPVQVVDAPAAVALIETDLSGVDEAAARERLDAWMTHDRAPVDLATDPVLSARLVKLADDDHALLLTVHHIAFDEWSEQLLWRELDQHYTAALDGRAADLAPLPVQYADYAAWQREATSGAALERQLAFWRGQLAGAAPLQLPTDRPRPPVRDGRGDQVSFAVPAEHARAIVALGREIGATPFMSLLAVYAVMLARTSGKRDITVGTPVANRDRAEAQDLIGLFLNTLVLRLDLDGEPTFREVLARVKETALEAYGHQDVPFEKLVEELGVERDPAKTPLFSTMFLLESTGAGRRRFADLATAPLSVGESAAKFDLTVAVAEHPDGSLAGAVNYATALFDRDTAERVAARFTTLAAGIAAAPDTPIGDLPVLPAAERAQVLGAWMDTAKEYPTGTLVSFFEQQVARTPDALAVASEHERLTYAELNARVNRLAHRLIGEGVGPESIVGVCRRRGAGLVEALLAVQKAGAAYLPLDPDYPAERVEFMRADAGAATVLTDEDPPADGPDHDPGVAIHPDHPAYVIYTSGSTGRPKGVVVSHRAIVNRLHWMQDAYGIGGDDRVLQKTPYSFDVSVWEFFWPLITGATLVMARPGGHRDPHYLAELITAERITTLHFVPSMLRAFLTDGFAALPSLRRMICSGEALPADLVDAVHERIGCELHNLYGPTEAAVDVTADRCAPGSPVTIGRPIANTRTYIVDDALRPVPVGVPGELLLGGVQLARGYLGRPGLTADRFVPDPFTGGGTRLYRTGDLARYLPDGRIEYLGRLDHQVKIRGHRVELGEVEAVLLQAPGVADAAAAVRSDALVGYLVADRGTEPDIPAVTAFLGGRLPSAMVPSAWVVLDALPLTASGKTDRGALPEPDRSRAAGEYTAPRTATERAVVDALAAALGVERVGVHDRFFDLGGDSIRAIRAIGALRADGFALSVQDVFTHQSAAELAALAGNAAAAAQDVLVEPFTQISEADRAKLPAGLADAYPLGQIQAGMLYEMQAGGEHTVYQNVTSFQIADDGPFSLDALREAAAMVIDRHDVLRTAFDVTTFSTPMQLVLEHAPLEVGYDDLRGMPESEQQAVISAYRDAMHASPVEVSKAPQLRWHAHQTGERDWVLTHTECHAILDGWSHHSLIAQLRETYRAVRDGDTDSLPTPPPARYADFVALEQRSLASPVDREYWRARVHDHDRLALPADTAPPGYGRVEELRVRWRHLEPALRALAASTRTSLKTVMHTAHLAMLGAISGQRRFYTGLVCNGRAELERGDEVIGMHLNTLPFAVDLAAPSWRDLLRAVFAEELALWPHRRYPLSDIQREWGRETPLISSIFSYLDFHVLDEQQSVFGEITDDSPNEFTLTVVTFPGELRIEARTGWATKERVDALGATFLHALESMIANDGANPVDLRSTPAALPTTPPRTWPALPELCVTDLVAAQVAARPDAVAVECGETGVTYRELDERANQLAHLLIERGVGPDTPVGVCMEHGVDVVTALLGVLKAGGCYLPLEPKHPDARLADIVADAGATLVLTRPESADRFPGALLVDPEWTLVDGRPATAPEVALAPDNLAYIVYTSGSTGRPKGVLTTHRNVVRLVLDADYTQLDADQVLLLFSTLAFDAATFEIWGALGNGARIAVAPSDARTAAQLEEVLDRHAVTTLFLTTGLFNALVDVRPDALARVRHVVTGGEALSPEHIRKAIEHGIPVGNIYGPTETTTFAVCRPRVDLADTAGPVPIGLPITHTWVEVVDEDLNPVPFGVPGELLIGGPGLARGYHGRPDLTAERFVPDPTRPGQRLYRTGDIVRRDPDLTLHYVGRRDHQVKVRGHRVELGEVEAAIGSLAPVRAAAAATVRGADGVTQLVGYAVVEETWQGSLADLMRASFPDFLVPTLWVDLPALPLTHAGKVDRAALPTPGAAAAREYKPPRTQAERAVADIWAEVFDLPRVARDDDFFALGGHSLLTLRVIALLRERRGVEMTVRSFLEHRTVEALAAAIDTGMPSRAVFWLNRKGEQTPLVCVHPGGGSAHWYELLAAHLDPDLPVLAIEWPNLHRHNGKVPTTEEMAARYVAELREEQPHGPYRVFSWCGGSGVGTEMARLLQDAGEEVTLILMDPAVDASEKKHLRNEFSLIQRCVSNLEALDAAPADLDTTALRQDTLALLEHLVDDIDDGITLPERGSGIWLPAVRMWDECMEMMLTYDHRPYPGRLHLIIGDELAQGEHEVTDNTQTYTDYLTRWRDLSDTLVVHRTPGDHFSIIKDHVTDLAATITAVLAED